MMRDCIILLDDTNPPFGMGLCFSKESRRWSVARESHDVSASP
jgi:hypothetical protein